MTFRVGQKVVCVVDQGEWNTKLVATKITLPVKNGIYTIREIYQGVTKTGECYVTLNEIVNPKVWHIFGKEEHRFFSEAFRPIVENKTDISVFEKLLDTNNHKIPITSDA